MQRQGKTPAEAERNLIKALKKRLAPAGEDLSRASTVRQLAAKWLEVAPQERELATQTLQRYTDLANRIVVGGLGDVRLGELTVPRVDRFLTTTKKRNGESTARTVRTIMLQMLGYAQRQGAIDTNPAEPATKIRLTKKAEIALTVPDIWRIRDLLAKRDAGTDKQGRRRYTQIGDVADMFAGTGARTNEILALGFAEQVFFDEPVPFVRLDRTLIVDDDGKLVVQMKTKTDKSMRDAKLPPSVVAMLMRRRMDAANDIVFPSSVGTHQWDNNLMRQWSAALRGTAYASVTPTVFRKAVATLLADEVGVKAAADQLGNTEEITQKHDIKRARTQGPDAARVALEAFFNPG